MTFRRFITVTGLFLIGCALSTSVVHAQSAQVRGTITDAQDQPIADVNVVLTRIGDGARVGGTSTSADGTFTVDDVEVGTYKLTASAVGYAQRSTTVTLDDGTTRVSLHLQKKPYGLDEVVVSAARTQQDLGDMASSVSILNAKDLETQSTITSDLGDMLAQTVPGLAPSNGSLSNFAQTMRGRSPFVMIDGVPQNTPLRDGARSLRTSSPEVIERIEVVRGASARYGYGATGGAINIITKEPTPELEATTEIGIRGSSADVEETFTGRLHQSVSGRVGGIGFVASGSYEKWGQFYDGKETLIAQDPRGQGGLAGADEGGLFGTVDIPLASSQRVSASINYYSFRQDLEYGRQPGEYGETPTSATTDPGTLPPKNPGTDNIVGQVRYDNNDLLGSVVSAQAYIQDFVTYFGYSDAIFPEGGQTFIESTKWGLRLDVTTPLSLTEESQLLWGVDALRDQTAQPLVDGRTFAPRMTQTSAAPFVQLQLPVNDRLTLRGGVRYEALSLRVDDFRSWQSNGDGPPIYDTQNDVKGGTLPYDNVAFNAGAVFTVIQPVDVFASFEQGFAVSEVGRVLRSTTASSVDALNPEAKTVNGYESGVRLGADPVRATLTGYYTTSELGSSYGPDFEIVRSPEHVYGVEATTDVRVADPVTMGGTFSWVKGISDTDNNGSYESPLPGNRIPPEKITAYVDATPIPGWTTRLQMLYSGHRDAFPESSSYGRGSVSPYTVFDLSTQLDVGPGALKIGIENLLDNYYFPVRSQYPAYNPAYTPGRGRNVSLSYSVTW